MENIDNNINECIICGQLFEVENWIDEDEDDYGQDVCPECGDRNQVWTTGEF